MEHEYGLSIEKEFPKRKFDAVVKAVAHREFKDMELGDTIYDLNNK